MFCEIADTEAYWARVSRGAPGSRCLDAPDIEMVPHQRSRSATPTGRHRHTSPNGVGPWPGSSVCSVMLAVLSAFAPQEPTRSALEDARGPLSPHHLGRTAGLSDLRSLRPGAHLGTNRSRSEAVTWRPQCRVRGGGCSSQIPEPAAVSFLASELEDFHFSKSNASTPRALISIRMAFVRPVANRVASRLRAPPANRRGTRLRLDGDRPLRRSHVAGRGRSSRSSAAARSRSRCATGDVEREVHYCARCPQRPAPAFSFCSAVMGQAGRRSSPGMLPGDARPDRTGGPARGPRDRWTRR